MRIGTARFFGILLAGISFFLGIPTFAQIPPTREKPFPEFLGARRWGPFLGDIRFSIQNFGYDNNIYLVSSRDPYRKPQGDFILRGGPEVSAQAVFRKNAALTINDRFAGEVFFKNSNLNHWDNNFDGQFDLALGPTVLSTKAVWNTVRWRPYSELTQRVRQDDISVTQEAWIFLGPFTDMVFRYGQSRYRYNEPGYQVVIDPGTGEVKEFTIDQALNRDTTEKSVEAGWKIRANTRFFGRVSRKDIDFQYVQISRDSEERRFVGGFQFMRRTGLSGRLSIGRTDLKAKQLNSHFKQFSGMIADANLAFRPSGTSRITATWRRDLFFSTYYSNLYYKETNRGLALDWYIGQSWGIQAGVSRRESRYPDPDPADTPNAGQKRWDNTDEFYAGILLRLKGGFEVGIKGGKRNRDSNVLSVVDDQTYITTTGSYVF